MTTESQLKTRVREAWHEAWDKGNVDALDGLLAATFTRTTEGSDTSLSAAEFKEEILATRRAFPDFTTTIDELVEDGDQLAIFWTSRGTHRDELHGIPTTNRRGHHLRLEPVHGRRRPIEQRARHLGHPSPAHRPRHLDGARRSGAGDDRLPGRRAGPGAVEGVQPAVRHRRHRRQHHGRRPGARAGGERLLLDLPRPAPGHGVHPAHLVDLARAVPALPTSG